jgi:hypothetical protein
MSEGIRYGRQTDRFVLVFERRLFGGFVETHCLDVASGAWTKTGPE